MPDLDWMEEAARLALEGSIDDIRSIWNISPEYVGIRAGILERVAHHARPTRTCLQVAWALVALYKKEGKQHLLDNALVSFSIGVRGGMDTVSATEIEDARAAAFEPPLGKENALQRLKEFCGRSARDPLV